MNDAQKQKNINEAEVKDRLGQVIRIKEEIGEQIIGNQLQMEKKKENQKQKEGEDLKLEKQRRNIKQRRGKYMEGKTYRYELCHLSYFHKQGLNRHFQDFIDLNRFKKLISKLQFMHEEVILDKCKPCMSNPYHAGSILPIFKLA